MKLKAKKHRGGKASLEFELMLRQRAQRAREVSKKLPRWTDEQMREYLGWQDRRPIPTHLLRWKQESDDRWTLTATLPNGLTVSVTWPDEAYGGDVEWWHNFLEKMAVDLGKRRSRSTAAATAARRGSVWWHAQARDIADKLSPNLAASEKARRVVKKIKVPEYDPAGEDKPKRLPAVRTVRRFLAG